MTTALATQNPSLVTRFADRFGVEANKLLTTLKATAFKQSQGKEVSTEQMMALLVVADQYGLNPFTKEIFAFDDKHKGIVPVVSVDGWSRIVNEHPQYDGVEFRYSDTLVTMPSGKPCPEWCEAVFARKDRRQPIVVREYLDEVYVNPRGNPPINGPWQTHTKRFLRHKTFIQGARIAFGFGGIHDEDEAYRIIEGESVRIVKPAASGVAALAQRLQQPQTEAVDAEFTEARSAEPLQTHDVTGDTDMTQAVVDSIDTKPMQDVGEIDAKKLRGRIFLAEDAETLAELEQWIGALPDGKDKDELNEAWLERRAEIGA